jgi:hypothetical protein
MPRSRYREETLYYRLVADGYDDKHYLDARLAGEAFAASRPESNPKLSREYRSFTTVAGEETQPVPGTEYLALTMKDGDTFKHLLLIDGERDFRAGYDTAHARVNQRVQAVTLQDVAPSPQPPGIQEAQMNPSGNSIELDDKHHLEFEGHTIGKVTFSKANAPSGEHYHVRVYAADGKTKLADRSLVAKAALAEAFGPQVAQAITASKGRTGSISGERMVRMGDAPGMKPVNAQQAPAAPRPAVPQSVGVAHSPLPDGPTRQGAPRENVQADRAVADTRGLTSDIEREFAQGLTPKQVTQLFDGKGKLDFLPREVRETFMTNVHASLGVPSQATAQGRQAFAAWKADFDARVAQGLAKGGSSLTDFTTKATAAQAANRADEAVQRAAAADRLPDAPAPAQSAADAAGEALEQRRREIVESLKDRFIVKGNAYHFKGAADRKAFEDLGSRLTTDHSTQFVVRGMLDLAEHKGWATLALKGTAEFRREAWLQASQRGMKTRGYDATAQDQRRLAELDQRQLQPRNVLEPGQSPARTAAAAPPSPDSQQREQLLNVVRASLRDGKVPQEAWATVLKAANDHIDGLQARGEPLPTVRVKDHLAPSQRQQPMPQRTDQHQKQRVRH